ncbi:CotH kinase family protein [Nocardioides sp. B-3]|uniref:CotH kinase family protein n=1 Tax=Nocardioides sp. B-3 TaxID=2895565 RepID=UPI0021532598|nr:CotH kinase family protein [Nocardioides sp. B-3]
MSGWRPHLDESAAVDYVLVNELFKNRDAFYSSTYLTGSAGSPRVLGPVWDFDISSGNDFRGAARFPRGSMLADRPWVERLYADPAFVSAPAARWQELRAGGLREELLGSVAGNARTLRSTGAAERNFRRWPVLGKRRWPNPPSATERETYGREVRALRRWLETRIARLDEHVDELSPAS